VAAEQRERHWWNIFTAVFHPGRSRLSGPAAAAVEVFGLQDDLDRTPGDLSYGRRRLVGIARAAALSPSILLLDEPAAGLSTTESEELGRLIRRLSRERGMGILLVEHDVDLVMSVCDRVTVLNFGQVIAESTPAEVRAHPGVIAAYLGEPAAAGDPATGTASAIDPVKVKP
jgi:sulfate-transporting ATPase